MRLIWARRCKCEHRKTFYSFGSAVQLLRRKATTKQQQQRMKEKKKKRKNNIKETLSPFFMILPPPPFPSYLAPSIRAWNLFAIVLICNAHFSISSPTGSLSLSFKTYMGIISISRPPRATNETKDCTIINGGRTSSLWRHRNQSGFPEWEESQIKIYSKQEPWYSGYGRIIVFRRSWVRIPAPYTGWS